VTIEAMIDAVIGREGGYTNNPADRGGPTRWGITEQTARAYGYSGAMNVLPRELAVEIYRKRYWTGVGFNNVGAVYPKVGEEMFDTGINMGPATAGKFLQRALNVLNRGHSDYGDIGVDGLIGPGTIAALKAYAAKRGAEGEAVLLRALDGLQAARYIDIAEKNPSQEAFVYGWLRTRVGALA